MYMSILLATALLFSSVPLQASHPSDLSNCRSALETLLTQGTDSFEPHYGEQKRTSEIPFAVPKGSRVYALGEGHSGGEVFRIYPAAGNADQEVKIYKLYGLEKVARADFRALQYLYRLSQKSGYKGFKIAKPISLNQNLMILESVIGQDILKMIQRQPPRVWRKSGHDERQLVPTDVRWIIDAEFDKQLDSTFAAIREEHPNLHRSAAGKGFDARFDDENGLRYSFFLKPDNVVLKNDWTMWIIDPN